MKNRTDKTIIIEEGLSLYKKTGTGQYAQNISRFLEELGYDVILRRKPLLEKINNSTVKRILYILWINIIFPFTVIFNPADKIIFTNSLTPFYRLPNKKYFPVLHDLCAYKYPETMSKTQRLYISIVNNSLLRTYTKIITVSETVKNEILDFYKCKNDDVKVIYNYFSYGEKPEIKLREQEQAEILKKYNLTSKKYILSVATLNKRKNIPMLIDAYNMLKNNDYKLVLAGGGSREKFDNNNENIVFTGYIDDEELKVLYKNAFLYVFPSIYEGFGIPIIDAQAFGIPVLCSDIPVFREVTGVSVEYSGIDNISIAEKMKYLINSKSRRDELIKLGEINIQRFTREIIKEVINGCINNIRKL